MIAVVQHAYTNHIHTNGSELCCALIPELLQQVCLHSCTLSDDGNKERHLGTNLAVQDLHNCAPLLL